jgi:hypothetical protein
MFGDLFGHDARGLEGDAGYGVGDVPEPVELPVGGAELGGGRRQHGTDAVARGLQLGHRQVGAKPGNALQLVNRPPGVTQTPTGDHGNADLHKIATSMASCLEGGLQCQRRCARHQGCQDDGDLVSDATWMLLFLLLLATTNEDLPFQKTNNKQAQQRAASSSFSSPSPQHSTAQHSTQCNH